MRRLRLPEQTLARHLLLAAVFAVLLYLLSSELSAFNDLRLASIGYYIVALAGLTALTGLSGQISLGHGALMAVGAYSAAILISRDGWALAPALAAATVLTAVAGALVGVVAARLRGPYLAGATLALAVGLPGLADKYPQAFGGENGLTVNPPIPPSWLGADFPLERWEAWIACGAALVAFVVLAGLARGRVGRALRAVRDDEVAAQLAGLDVARAQILAFIVSAACAGLAGGAFVAVTQIAAPGAFQLTLSLSLLTGIVLGGLGSLWGALWGAIVLVLLPSWSSDVGHALSLPGDVRANLPLALYGLALIGLMALAPRGIQGLVKKLARLVRARVAPNVASNRSTTEEVA